MCTHVCGHVGSRYVYSMSPCDSSSWAHTVTAGTGVLEQKMGDCGFSALHIYSFSPVSVCLSPACLSPCLPAFLLACLTSSLLSPPFTRGAPFHNPMTPYLQVWPFSSKPCDSDPSLPWTTLGWGTLAVSGSWAPQIPGSTLGLD